MSGIQVFEPVRKTREESDQNRWFLATVSHEMRGPVTAVLGMTQMLQASDEDLTHDEREAMLDLILTQGRRLNRLVDDVLDATRIDVRGVTVNQERVSIAEVVGEALATLEGNTHFIKVDLFGDLPSVVADGDRLQQVVSNLLTNAVKYSPVDTTITITAGADSETLALAVSDEGNGIDSAFLPHIFEPFAQRNEQTGRVSGLGLGLYITKNLVDAMGGSISVTSEVGHGTTFVVRLPRAK